MADRKVNGRPKATNSRASGTRPKVGGGASSMARPKLSSGKSQETKRSKKSGKNARKAQIIAAAIAAANAAKMSSTTSVSDTLFDDALLETNLATQNSVVVQETSVTPQVENVDVGVSVEPVADVVATPAVEPVVSVNVEPTAEAPQVEAEAEAPTQTDAPTSDVGAGVEDFDIDDVEDFATFAASNGKQKMKKDADADDELNKKKKKKKKWWLWLLLLLLLLLATMGYAFKDVLFPPKPIVIVPDGITINIKDNGSNNTNVGWLFKPGDTIEFDPPITVGSARYVENEDGSKTELSPFSMRVRFYILENESEYPELIDVVTPTENTTLQKFGSLGWYYWYGLAIPGQAYQQVISSIHLSEEKIGNYWKEKEVSLVLEYQTITPTNLGDIEDEFDGDFDPVWAEIVIEMYNDYVG